jgi:UDPglucose 6-dehydrogenase
MTPTVAFAGMSHLGLVSAAALASRGVRVVGFDADASLIGRIQAGELPVVEPGLPELLANASARPNFTADPEELRQCDVVYFALDVATDDAGLSDLAPYRRLLDATWGHLGSEATAVILSQVPPGFTRELARTRMAAAPRPGSLYYQVETLIFGRAVERALGPERYIVGCADPSNPLPDAFAAVLGVGCCPVLPMRYESAELAKISINFFLVSSLCTTNLLAEVCEQVGAEWREIAPALRLDARIGQKAYLDAGLGFGGGNLGRDLATVKGISQRRGTDTRLIDAWLANSAYRRDWALRMLRTSAVDAQPGVRLAVWGLAYKQHTASTKNSPGVALLQALGDRPATAYDPAAELPASLAGNVAIAPDPLTACRGADALLVMTPWPEFSTVPVDRIASAMRGRVLIDPVGIIDPERAAAHGFTHLRLGSPLTETSC